MRWALILIISLLILGCNNSDKEVLDVVKSYNETESIALSRPQPELMSRIASEKEQSRILAYIFYWQQKQKVLDSKMDQISLLDVKETKEETKNSQQKKESKIIKVVITKEEWRFRHLDAKTKKPTDNWQKESYRVKYNLIEAKGDKRWIVDKVEILETKAIK